MSPKPIIVFLILASLNASAQINTLKHVAANGGSIKSGGTYSSISVAGEMAVSSFSTSSFSGTIGYLDEDDVLFPTAVKFVSGTIGEITLFPNPNKGAFTLKIVSQNNVEARLSLVDVLGRLGQQKTVQVSFGQNIIPYYDIPNGVWLLKIEAEGQETSRKFIVQQN